MSRGSLGIILGAEEPVNIGIELLHVPTGRIIKGCIEAEFIEDVQQLIEEHLKEWDPVEMEQGTRLLVVPAKIVHNCVITLWAL